MTTWPETRYSLLARLADASDREAWEEFQRQYQPAVYRYARSRGLQEADSLEVVQEVMLAVHRALGDWRPSNRPGSFRAWLAETARRVTLQILRQRCRSDGAAGGSSIRRTLESIPIPAIESTSDLEYQRWLFFCAAGQVEQEVHESTWRAFWLTAVDGLSAESVSQQLSISLGTVYTSKCRVLARIRHCIQTNLQGDLQCSSTPRDEKEPPYA